MFKLFRYLEEKDLKTRELAKFVRSMVGKEIAYKWSKDLMFLE